MTQTNNPLTTNITPPLPALTRKIRTREHRSSIHPRSNSESKVKASLGPATDINYIVAKFQQTGMLNHVSPLQPKYGDFSQAISLKHAMDTVNDAWADFDSLPHDVIRACGADPTRMLEMLATQEGCEKLKAAGLPLELPPAEPPAKIAEPPAPTSTPDAEPTPDVTPS